MKTKEELEKERLEKERLAEEKKQAQKDLEALIAEKSKESIEEQMKAFEKTLDERMKKFQLPVDRKGIGVDEDGKKQAWVEPFVKSIQALAVGDIATVKALSESGGLASGTAGGYLVPEEFVGEVLRIAPDYGIFRRECRIIPVKRTVLRMPKAGATGVTVTWTGEAEKKSETQPNFGIVKIDIKKLTAITPYSDELIEDADIDVVNYLAMLFAGAFAQEEDVQGFTGSGSPITGIDQASGVDVVHLTGNYTSTMTADKLLDMQLEIPSAALKGAKYYLSAKVLSYIRRLKDDEGRYIYQQPGGPETATIWGYPRALGDALPNATTADAPVVFFGNLKYALLGDRKKITMDIAKEATLTNTGNLFEQDMKAMRLVERLDIQIPIGKAFSVLRNAEGY